MLVKIMNSFIPLNLRDMSRNEGSGEIVRFDEMLLTILAKFVSLSSFMLL